MAKRFKTASIPNGEVARYTQNPYETNFLVNGYLGRGAAGSIDLVVRPQDELLLQKGGAEAFNVYQKLLFDETVQSSLVKMSQEITSRAWKIEAASDKPGDQAVKEFVEEKLKVLQMDEIYRGLLESYIVGYSVGEVMWRRTKSGIVPFDFRFRDQRRFRFQEQEDADLGFTMRMATVEDPFVGQELPARKFVVFRYWAQSNGDPYGAGLGRILYPLVKFKRRALESQLLYSDRFANPTAIATAPMSATTCEIDTLYSHLSNLSQETALVLPEGFNIDFANPGGSPETFNQLRYTLSSEINTLIAGEDEAGQSDSGSRASSEVAQTVRIVRARDLSELISGTLNDTLIRWLVDLNFGTHVVSPHIYRDFDPDQDVQLSMADVATLVKDIGYMPTKEWIVERFDVELEEEEDEEKRAGVLSARANPNESVVEEVVEPTEEDPAQPAGPLSGQGGVRRKQEPEPETEDLSDKELDDLINDILGL